MASDKHMDTARNLRNAVNWQSNASIEIIATALEAAEREGMKRGADFANKQFEYCRERKSSADTATQDNFWGGCADTAAIIRDLILSEAKEGE